MTKKLSLHLSLLKRAMRGFQGTPAQTGKEGLFRLVEQAQVSYKEEVATRQKSYRRYVLDFIHSKRFHDATDAWSKMNIKRTITR